MFKKLKRKFILTNLITTTLVLLIAFASIYLIVAGSVNHRADHPQEFMPMPEGADQQISKEMDQQFNQEMDQRLKAEREASLSSLLITLIVTGIAVEIIVALISLYLAEQSIKPVREAYNAQKDFVANASHEIKTPLAIIQANLEAADIKGNRWINNAIKKTGDLAQLNNKLLALARSESAVEDNKSTPTNVAHLVEDAVSAFIPKASSKKITIDIDSDVSSSDKTNLNRQALEQILNIYIDNAIKYGKKTIKIIIRKNHIDVVSDGKPLQKSDLSKIFNRFYQTDKTSSGVGLGLSIAKAIAEKNHWKVYATVDNQSKQNIFTVEYK